MILLKEIDKVVSDGDLPPLPPFLERDRRPDKKIIIVPDILCGDRVERIHDHENNWITLIYTRMSRIYLPEFKVELAHTATRRYKNWLSTYTTKDGVPPHICFGGAIKPGSGDPTFKPRWVEFVRDTFV